MPSKAEEAETMQHLRRSLILLGIVLFGVIPWARGTAELLAPVVVQLQHHYLHLTGHAPQRGEYWELAACPEDGPWGCKAPILVTIQDVRDGWVRYRDVGGNDERERLDIFVRLYRKTTVQATQPPA